MTTAVDVSGLVYAYPKGPSVLDIPKLTIERGERVFLHGPSGSGKTTLLGLLSGILTPKTGTVHILDAAFDTMGGHARDLYRGAHLGYIFQMFNLIPYLNVRDNILLPCRLSSERRARVEGGDLEREALALADRLGIGALIARPVTELSVGQQQRVAAARALIGRPGLVIADEPTSALDTAHREAFLKLLFEEAERAQATVLFVSHDHTLMPLFPKIISLPEINRAATRT